MGAPGGGPARVITDLGVYGFDGETREMTLESVHPGVGLEQVRAHTGWELRVAPTLAATEAPTPGRSDCSAKNSTRTGSIWARAESGPPTRGQRRRERGPAEDAAATHGEPAGWSPLPCQSRLSG